MQIAKEVEQLLNSGLSREEVFEKLRGRDDDDEIIYFANNVATLADKHKYMALNLILIGLLVLLTGKKVMAIIAFPYFNITTIIPIVVPAVNAYIIRELLRFHKKGYTFLFVLSILSLVHKENHFPFELLTTISMIVLSGFLYKKIFNKNKLLPEIDD